MPTTEAALPWQGGWHSQARHCPSPNAGERPDGALIDLIVVHSISLPPGEYGGPQVRQLFCNTLDVEAHPYFAQLRGLQVSSHFFIRRDGALWQFVDCDRRAWHAGRSCWRGRDNCNDDSVGIELEGLEGESFEAAQYQRLAHLCVDVRRRYPVEFVAGHSDIASGRKADPGAGFEWARLRSLLAWPDRVFPPISGTKKPG